MAELMLDPNLLTPSKEFISLMSTGGCGARGPHRSDFCHSSILAIILYDTCDYEHREVNTHVYSHICTSTFPNVQVIITAAVTG